MRREGVIREMVVLKNDPWKGGRQSDPRVFDVHSKSGTGAEINGRRGWECRVHRDNIWLVGAQGVAEFTVRRCSHASTFFKCLER
jgi:hypothetical protein